MGSAGFTTVRDGYILGRNIVDPICIPIQGLKGAGSFHIHRKTMKELGTLAVLGVWEQPNLAQNLVTHRH